MLTKCRYLLLAFSLLAFTGTSFCPPEAYAATSKKSVKTVKKNSKKNHRKMARRAAERPQKERFAALVVEANTGRVLYQDKAGSLRYPASLTKMMTLYLTFDALKQGTLSINQNLPVSEKAAGQPQTNIALDPGDSLSVRTAIESVVVRSANDSAMVLAEALGKTEWNFALMMTQKARELGMKNTEFRNPSGLPDPTQHTTAYDMARLAIALRRDFPEYYHYFSLQSFDFRGVTYAGHNRVLARFDGADGVKTGFIRASGFNLVTSAQRGGVNLVAVVMGGRTAQNRDDQMINLLDRSFADMENRKKNLATKGGAANDDDAASVTLDIPVPLKSGTHG